MKPVTLYLPGTLACIALLLAAIQPAAARDNSFASVGAIWLDTNGCSEKLISELEDDDYVLASHRRAADAVLKVDVHQLDAHTGASARYAATLEDDRGRVLMRTSGREDAISQHKLCANITDDVMDRLSDRPLG
jgi:hypothetical protein